MATATTVFSWEALVDQADPDRHKPVKSYRFSNGKDMYPALIFTSSTYAVSEEELGGVASSDGFRFVSSDGYYFVPSD